MNVYESKKLLEKYGFKVIKESELPTYQYYVYIESVDSENWSRTITATCASQAIEKACEKYEASNQWLYHGQPDYDVVLCVRADRADAIGVRI